MDRYPYTNFHELNLTYFLKHFKEIFEQWDSLYNEMLSWKTATTEELETWKNGVVADIEAWEAALLGQVGDWEDALMTALDAWKEAFETLFESTFSDLEEIKTAAEAARDEAEAARDEAIAAIPSIIYHTIFDVFDPEFFSDKTSSHATFEWNNDKTVCTINSTDDATAGDFVNVITFNNSRPLIPGASYYIEFDRNNDDVNVQILWYDSSTNILGALNVSSGDYITIPANVNGTAVNKALVRFIIKEGVQVSSATISDPHMFTVFKRRKFDTNDLSFIFHKTTDTSAGVTYTWNNDKTECVLSGTQSSTSIYRLYYGNNVYQETFPEELIKGKSYYVDYQVTDPRVSLHFYFYRKTGSNTYETIQNILRAPGLITVPVDNASGNVTGCMVRFYVSSTIITGGYTVTVKSIKIYDEIPDAVSLAMFEHEALTLRFMQYNAGMLNFGTKTPYGLDPSTYTSKVAAYKSMLAGLNPDVMGIEEYPPSLDIGTSGSPGSVDTSTLFNDTFEYSAIDISREKAIFSQYPISRNFIVTITPEGENTRRNGLVTEILLPNGKKLAVMVTAFESSSGEEHNRLVKLDLQGAIDALSSYEYAFILADVNNNGLLSLSDCENIVKETSGQTYSEGDFTESEKEEVFLLKQQSSIDEGKELVAIAESNGWFFSMGDFYTEKWQQTYNDPRRPWMYNADLDNIIVKNNDKLRFKTFSVIVDEKKDPRSIEVSGDNTAEDIAARKANKYLASDHYPVYAEIEIL